MKKFTAVVLTFVMVMCLACTVFGSTFDGTTIAVEEGNDNFVIINNTVFDGHADDEAVVITLSVKDHFAANPGYSWCINDSAAEGYKWWEHDVAGTQSTYPGDFKADGETSEISYTVADFKAMMAAGGDGIVLNCWGGIVPTKIVMGTGAPTGDATPITAIVIMALASCAALVVLRKREA